MLSHMHTTGAINYLNMETGESMFEAAPVSKLKKAYEEKR